MSTLLRVFLTSEKVVVISVHLREVSKQEELTLVIELRTVVALGGWWRVLLGEGVRASPGLNVQCLDLGGGHIGVCTPSNSLGCTLKICALHCVSVFTLCE